MNTGTGRLAAFVAATLLAACDSGGGGGSSNVSLKSEQDIIREISNLSTLYGESGTVAKSMSTNSSRRPGVRGLIGGSRADRTQGAQAKSMSPRAAETVQCDSGSYSYEDFIETLRELPLFATSATLDYYIQDNNNCLFVDGTIRVTRDGRTEYGDNEFYAEGTEQAPYYDYFADGSGSTPYVFTYEDTDFDEKVTLKTLGRSEYRDNGTIGESREIVSLDFRYQYDGQSLDLDVKAGETGNPFVVVDKYVGGTFSVDGPMRYSSDFCDGGRIEFTTVEDLSFGTDDFGTFINGGRLVLESGNRSVTLVFLSDGTVQYEFADGTSGEISREELMTGEQCVFVPYPVPQ